MIGINGGITTDAKVQAQLAVLDGFMVGREAYHHPWWLAGWDSTYYGDPRPELTREGIEERMVAYMERQAALHDTPWSSIARHMMGLYNGVPGARRWRQVWSDHRLKSLPPRELMRLAAPAEMV